MQPVASAMITLGPVTRSSVFIVSAQPQPAQALWPDANKSSSAAIYIPSGRMPVSSLYHSISDTFSPLSFAEPFVRHGLEIVNGEVPASEAGDKP